MTDYAAIVERLARVEETKQRRRRHQKRAARDRLRASYKERYDSDPGFREREKRRHKVAYARLTSEQRLLRAAKKRAKRLGLPFDLTAEYLRSVWPVDGRCPVLGFRMLWDTEDGAEIAPSLDRLNREAGYVKGNVAVISGRANRIKSDAHWIELEKIAAYARRLGG